VTREARKRIILALDVASRKEALKILQRFRDHLDIFKVGHELFTSTGPEIIEDITSMGKKVFLDLKYHDIPNTVARAVVIAAEFRVFMLNLHTLGGFEMMSQAARTLREVFKKDVERPRLLGVVIHLTGLALKAGLDGVIASPQDIESLRSHHGRNFLIVTPGIRPSWATKDDQKRISTPEEALRKGADYIVIGRAILCQPDPVSALRRIEDEIMSVC
jgi:orotidine-5'-phosphate decarboxylase